MAKTLTQNISAAHRQQSVLNTVYQPASVGSST